MGHRPIFPHAPDNVKPVRFFTSSHGGPLGTSRVGAHLPLSKIYDLRQGWQFPICATTSCAPGNLLQTALVTTFEGAAATSAIPLACHPISRPTCVMSSGYQRASISSSAGQNLTQDVEICAACADAAVRQFSSTYRAGVCGSVSALRWFFVAHNGKPAAPAESLLQAWHCAR